MTAKRPCLKTSNFDVIILCSCTEILIMRYYWEIGEGWGREGGWGGGEKTGIIQSLSNIYVESCIK